jgi:hypothetical protein
MLAYAATRRENLGGGGRVRLLDVNTGRLSVMELRISMLFRTGGRQA